MAQTSSYEARVRRAHVAREVIEVVLLIGVIVFVIRLGVQTYSVNGDRMKPALSSGQFVIVNKLAYLTGSPQRGDVILFNYPTDGKESASRIIAIPKDTVELTPNSVMVNKHILNEPYASTTDTFTSGTVTLGANEYFVLNDNRAFVDGTDNTPRDSRSPYLRKGDGSLGVVDRKFIIGKATLVYWPLNKLHGLDNYEKTFSGISLVAPSQSPLTSFALPLIGLLAVTTRWRYNAIIESVAFSKHTRGVPAA